MSDDVESESPDASIWSRFRKHIGLGPTRAQLIAEAQAWRDRCKASNDDRDLQHARFREKKRAAHEQRVRADQAEKQLRQAEQELEQLRHIVRTNVEPNRVEGCNKVRFHQESEAAGWAETVGNQTGEGASAYRTYQCKLCPRSPVTNQRYWHITHADTEQAKQAKAAGLRRRREGQAAAHRAGRTLGQRVDPTVLDALRGTQEE